MGTVKAWLRDDPGPAPDPIDWTGVPGDTPTDSSVPVVTDDDVPAGPTVSVNPRLTVRLRTRTGFDEEGTPQFDWTVLLEAEAILFEARDEFDAVAGLTSVKATATLLYAGPVQVPETAAVTDENGVLYRVEAVRQVPGRLQFDMERVD